MPNTSAQGQFLKVVQNIQK